MDIDSSDISICNITNKENGENLTVYSEWSDLKLKIVITKTDQILEGEVLKQDFSCYAETFEKSVTDFLKETQEILSGKCNDIDFILKNEKFFWKRKKWSLGQINVKELTDNSHISSLFSSILNKFSKCIKTVSENKEKQFKDTNTISKLRASNDDLIKKNEESELKWYKRTILLVNSKKEKIRDMKKKVEKCQPERDPIFYADTENSESETETAMSINIRQSNKKPKHCLKSDVELTKQKKCDISVQTEILSSTISDTKQKLSKRKSRSSSERDDEELIKKKKCDIFVQTEYLTEESSIKEKETFASTSKSFKLTSDIGEDEETPDLLTDESECEVELKFEDDKHYDTETQGKSMIQEESSEELF